MARIEPIDVDQMSPEQKAVHDAVVAGPRGRFGGPFPFLLGSPDVCSQAQQLGAYLRFGSDMPDQFREFCIITVARHYGAKYEWGAHASLALKHGLPSSVIEALKNRQRPDFPDQKFEVAYDFLQALLKGGVVDQAIYDRTTATFDNKTVVDLIGIAGFYSLISMVLNTFDKEHGHPDAPVLPD